METSGEAGVGEPSVHVELEKASKQCSRQNEEALILNGLMPFFEFWTMKPYTIQVLATYYGGLCFVLSSLK